MKPIFVQLQCAPGKTYEVADALYATELISELYSTSGEYDLLLKVYVDSEEDIGKFINDHVASIPGIDDATFQDLAAKAKAGCPVSKVLNAEITMDAKLG